MRRVSTPFGFVGPERVSVGDLARPYSFFEALEQASAAGARLLTSAEYGKAIEHAEARLAEAGATLDHSAQRTWEGLLLDLHGFNTGPLGYAGAKELTATVINFRDAWVQNVESSSGQHFFGPKSYYAWLPQLLAETRRLQRGGRAAYIREFDPELGLPVRLGAEPNPELGGAFFWVWPDVEELGVVVRGLGHASGSPGARFNVEVVRPEYKDVLLGHRLVSQTDGPALAFGGLLSTGWLRELADDWRRGRISHGRLVEKLGAYVGSLRGPRLGRRAFVGGLAGLLYAAVGAREAEAATVSGTITQRIARELDGLAIPIEQGEVTLTREGFSRSAFINADGTFVLVNIPQDRTYELSIEDFPPPPPPPPTLPLYASHKTLRVRVNRANFRFLPPDGSITVIEFGSNGLINFESVQAEYSQTVQRTHISGLGVLKWGQRPVRVLIMERTFPADCRQGSAAFDQFRADYQTIVSEDSDDYFGDAVQDGNPAVEIRTGTKTTIPLGTIGVLGHSGPTVTDHTLVENRRIRKSRTRWNQMEVCEADGGLLPAVSFEYALNGGRTQFTGSHSDPLNASGNRSDRPTTFTRLMGLLQYAADTHPGNTATQNFPDTNP